MYTSVHSHTMILEKKIITMPYKDTARTTHRNVSNPEKILASMDFSFADLLVPVSTIADTFVDAFLLP
ncbi:hypothetical protein Q6251_30910, partial [Klebsiella quasipneumoniae]|nr:hypothetical protein [Klebsiella quasipneumoniae]